jgi:hypothetical protein
VEIINAFLFLHVRLPTNAMANTLNSVPESKSDSSSAFYPTHTHLTNEVRAGTYLYIGERAPSLYQITRYTLSPGMGGAISQAIFATPPATACASDTRTGTGERRMNHKSVPQFLTHTCILLNCRLVS